MSEKPQRVVHQILAWDRKGVAVLLVWFGVTLILTAAGLLWSHSIPAGILALFWIPTLYLGGECLFEMWQALPFMRAWKESLPKPESELGFDEERLIYSLVATAPPMIAIILLVIILSHLFGIY